MKREGDILFLAGVAGRFLEQSSVSGSSVAVGDWRRFCSRTFKGVGSEYLRDLAELETHWFVSELLELHATVQTRCFTRGGAAHGLVYVGRGVRWRVQRLDIVPMVFQGWHAFCRLADLQVFEQAPPK